MQAQREVSIRRCRCYECCSELSFGEENVLVLFAVLSGWLKVRVGEEEHLLGENSLILKAGSGLSVSLGKGERATVLLIEFDCPDIQKRNIFGRVIALGKTKRRYIGEIIREMSRSDTDEAELFYEPRSEYADFGEGAILENALSSLLVRIVRDSLSEGGADSAEDFEIRNKAQAVRLYLYENYRTRITLDSLCFIFRSNKTTICKQFREEYGMTVLSYLNSLRIKEARRLLLEERLSVTEIADTLGFESIHYFTRFFKKTTGQTPTEYARIVGQRKKFMENE